LSKPKQPIHIHCYCPVPISQVYGLLVENGYEVKFGSDENINHDEVIVLLGDLLTDREVEVLKRIAQGQTIARIANDMRLSVNSVDRQLRSVRRKLAARSTIQAVMKGLRYGYLS